MIIIIILLNSFAYSIHNSPFSVMINSTIKNSCFTENYFYKLSLKTDDQYISFVGEGDERKSCKYMCFCHLYNKIYFSNCHVIYLRNFCRKMFAPWNITKLAKNLSDAFLNKLFLRDIIFKFTSYKKILHFK